jgi:CO/xanthine dehydrogenase Mo-binding subunit
MDIDVLLDGGAYTTLSPVVLSRAVLHATGPYRCANVRVRGRVVATNHVPYGAFRGFGAPQVCFAVERQMDRIARALGVAPLHLRRHNAFRRGDVTATGQRLDSVASAAVLDAVAARLAALPEPTPRDGSVRTGRGLSFFWHGAGFTGAGEQQLKSRVAVRLDADGRAWVHAAATEIGQGTRAMFLAIAAESLGCGLDDVAVADADTGAVPNSGPTVASRTCMVVGQLVARAAASLRQRLGAPPAAAFRSVAAAFVRSGGDALAEAEYAPPPGLRWDDAAFAGDAYPTYAWAADVVDVQIDLATFAVRCTRFVTAVDVGRAIQPLLAEGQIEGGTLQALGFAHLEKVSARDGRFAEDRMATCIVPTAVDAPPMHVVLVEEPFAHGPFGAKGIGELPMDGGAPAVAAAVEAALGIAVDTAPMTPERLFEAWVAAHPQEALP